MNELMRKNLERNQREKNLNLKRMRGEKKKELHPTSPKKHIGKKSMKWNILNAKKKEKTTNLEFCNLKNYPSK